MSIIYIFVNLVIICAKPDSEREHYAYLTVVDVLQA